ncbi:hypothetical protein FOZ60_014514 [Perkinsus olseni]|uniref:Uncharacterized protein n=1 Tax=Perkinsus olseni TaxID=32597 RepID=A0A7J6P6V3_PEROL|nr:hypothetical protein FOZ60_014514 [Perkinsus olseni]
MFRLLLLLGIIGGLTKAMSPHRGPSSGNAALSPEDEYCQSLCGSPPTSICGDKGSYCKPYGPPENGVGVCQGFYYLPNNSMCYFGPFTTSIAHPTGLYVDGGHQRGTYYRVSVFFSGSSTVLDHLNITIFGFPPAIGEGLPYSMAGNKIVILDYNSIPAAARPLAKQVTLEYDRDDDSIAFSIPGVISITLHRPSPSRS